MNEFKPTQRATVVTSLARTPTGIRVLAFEETGTELADNVALGL
jgi:hypothetical protein